MDEAPGLDYRESCGETKASVSQEPESGHSRFRVWCCGVPLLFHHVGIQDMTGHEFRSELGVLPSITSEC